MKYLRKFANQAAHDSATLYYPSVSLLDNTGEILYEPTEPGIPSTEIWYTTSDNNPYPLDQYITGFRQMGATYNGPEVLSNSWDSDKQMYIMTFDDNVTLVGDVDISTRVINGPFFVTNPSLSINCSVETVTLPNSVTSIGKQAFYNTADLISVTLPNSVLSIGKQAFCHSLIRSINLSSVTSIGEEAFSSCLSLTNVDIPSSVTTIGEYAFSDCSGLSVVNCLSEVPPTLGSFAFDSEVSGFTIYVPSSSLSDYMESWSNYAEYIQEAA